MRNDLSHMSARRARIGPVRASRTGPIMRLSLRAQRQKGRQ
ncbi:hypothetical protein HMPREF9057_00623 [Actinomyces sp. oral taxon 171 str. F0337]|nr:hypothetical protein HMPREF9057_00623 [Actinomyces sp. oral taxon 171 str. F0337]